MCPVSWGTVSTKACPTGKPCPQGQKPGSEAWPLSHQLCGREQCGSEVSLNWCLSAIWVENLYLMELPPGSSPQDSY